MSIASSTSVADPASGPDVAVPSAAFIDGALVARAQAGDAEAAGELAAQARPLVQRYARRLLADPQRAEDLAQTALMKAFSRIADVRSPEAFQAWLLRIVRNECLNELARRKHAQLPLSSLGDGAMEVVAPAGGDDDPEEALLRAQLRALVRRVAATLPAHHRQALVMRALEDRSYEEISEALDVPVNVVRVWYFRARKRFRSAFVSMMVARRDVPALCQEMGEAIAEMIEGTLPASDRPRIEEHLHGCHVCRQTEDELRNTAFRTPSRAMVIGLGLLRLGWKLPRRAGGALDHGSQVAARLALAGAGGVVLATAVAGSPPSISAPGSATGRVATSVTGAGTASTSATTAAGTVDGSAPSRPAAVASVPSLPGLPTLLPDGGVPALVQQVGGVASTVTQVAGSALRQAQQTLGQGGATLNGVTGSLRGPAASPSAPPLRRTP